MAAQVACAAAVLLTHGRVTNDADGYEMEACFKIKINATAMMTVVLYTVVLLLLCVVQQYSSIV